MITKGLMAASTKPILLSILSRGKSYGYDIIQQVKQQSGGRLEWSDGMLYPVLHKLEKEKLLGSEWQVSDDGRKRKYYFITPEGMAVLEAEKDNWLQVHNTLMRLWNQPEMKWTLD